MNDLPLRIASLSEHGGTPEQFAEIYGALEVAAREHRELMGKLQAAMIEHIRTTGPIEWPTDDKGNVQRFWLGHQKDTECKDLKLAAETLLAYSLDDLIVCLSSNAFKHGAAKKILKPEEWNAIFEVRVKDKLESGAALPKSLQSANTRFLK